MSDKICQVCGICIAEDSSQVILNTGKVVGLDFVKTRICNYASADRQSLCLNKTGQTDPVHAWQALPDMPSLS